MQINIFTVIAIPIFTFISGATLVFVMWRIDAHDRRRDLIAMRNKIEGIERQLILLIQMTGDLMSAAGLKERLSDFIYKVLHAGKTELPITEDVNDGG